MKIWKFETEALGAFKIKFSNSGKYLAAACTTVSSKTLIKIFDVENGDLRIVLRGHHDLVHDLVLDLVVLVARLVARLVGLVAVYG